MSGLDDVPGLSETTSPLGRYRNSTKLEHRMLAKSEKVQIEFFANIHAVAQGCLDYLRKD